MTNILANIFAGFITVPILSWVFLYFIFKWITDNEKRAFKWSVDITTFLAIISVYFIIEQIWGHSLLWLIFLVVLSSGALFTVFYWKIKQDIDPVRLIRGIWRLNFLIFMAAYVVLFFYGMIEGVLSI